MDSSTHSYYSPSSYELYMERMLHFIIEFTIGALTESTLIRLLLKVHVDVTIRQRLLMLPTMNFFICFKIRIMNLTFRVQELY